MEVHVSMYGSETAARHPMGERLNLHIRRVRPPSLPLSLSLACFVPMLGFLLQTLVSGGAACLTSCDSVRWELFYENGKKNQYLTNGT